MDFDNPFENNNKNDDFDNPFQDDFNNNNKNDNYNPYEENSKDNNTNNNMGPNNLNDNNDFSNPFKSSNNDNTNNNNIGPNNLNDNNDFSNPFKNSYNDNTNNNNNNEYCNPFEEDFKKKNTQNNFQNNNNNNNNEFCNPFEEDFKKNNTQNTFQNNNNNNEFCNPFEEDFKKNNNNNNEEFSNPFKDEFNDNKSMNNNSQYTNPFGNSSINNNNNPYGVSMIKNSYMNNFEGNSINQSFHPNPFDDNNNSNFNPNNNSNFNSQINNNNNNNNNNNVFNQPNNENPNLDTANEKDLKQIKAIIEKCQSYLDESKQLYDSFNIREAITKLCKTINGLDKLKSTINNEKKFFSVLLPQIKSLRDRCFSTLQEYRVMVYKLIPIRFQPVLYRPYEQNETLIDFCAKYILKKPFITFNDIYESNSIEEPKKFRNLLPFQIDQANKAKNKSFLIYGPHGCGKTLIVHALAEKLGARIAQIEGVELFKIPFFSREFMKACFGCMQLKPLIIYMKNIETMFTTINNFNYIYDKVCSSFHLNVYFFGSSSINVYNLPRQITDKFHFFQLVKPIDNNSKGDYIRFIGKKIGIEIKMNDKDLTNFAIENLYNFSNADIFDFIKNAIELKKKYSPPDDENWVYREGLLVDDLMDALGSVKGSLTTEVLKSYYL